MSFSSDTGAPDLARTEAALRGAGLRPTAARRRIYETVFQAPQPRHWDAGALAAALAASGEKVALASVYNVLDAFADAGLLKKIHLGGGAAVFDTDVSPHLHIMLDDDGSILNLHETEELYAFLKRYVDEPEKREIDVVIRVRGKAGAGGAQESGEVV